MDAVSPRPAARRALRILFSAYDPWEGPIREAFARSTPPLPAHALTFDDMSPAQLRAHDLVVPLTIDDLLRLDACRDLVARNPIPLPDAACVALCDDKLRLNEALVANGFARCVPLMGDFQVFPWILKKRVDAWGENSFIVASPSDESRLADLMADPTYFRQEYIPGRREYTAHVLFRGGSIVHAAAMEFRFDRERFVKGRDADRDRGRCECPFLDVFARMLASIGFEGLCCFNYKVVDGRPLVFEVNPRFGASLAPMFPEFVDRL